MKHCLLFKETMKLKMELKLHGNWYQDRWIHMGTIIIR